MTVGVLGSFLSFHIGVLKQDWRKHLLDRGSWARYFCIGASFRGQFFCTFFELLCIANGYLDYIA